MGHASAVESLFTDADPLSAYLKEIGRNRVLTRGEERALLERIARGDKRAAHELVNANLKFVVSVCRQFRNQGLPMTDLISEGNLGLMRAAECFDETRTCRFISYAVWWIRQRILRALAEQSRFITIPVAKAAAMRRISAAEKLMSQRKGRVPSSAELAEYLSLREQEVLDLQRLGQYATAVQEPEVSDAETGIGELSEEGSSEDPEQRAERESLRQEVREALEGLKEKEREVLRLHFGIGNTKPMSLEQVGAAMGLTRAQVRRIRDGAMSRLRQPVRSMRFRELI